uniref:Uncharacterized protein n=1 Tax=Oryza punctata TaxID=4537 RepID=A0A0E0LL18_ORYPU
MPSMMVQSAGIKRLRREMELSRRRSLELAPTGRVAKKSPSSSPHHSSLNERSAVVLALPAPPPVPTRRPAPASAATDQPTTMIKEGTQVSVRTRVGKISIMGQGQHHQTRHLVLRLDAVVVSADEDGFLDVVYNVKFPRDDPFRPVRVARDQVKVTPPAAACTSSVDTSTDAAVPRSTTTKSKDKSAQRPTGRRQVSATADNGGEEESWNNY